MTADAVGSGSVTDPALEPVITRCAVLGSPIRHSLSPALHRAAYAALGLTGWVYERYEVDADRLADFVASRDGSWRGLSMTKPLKVAALALGRADPVARSAGGANTLIFDGDQRRLYNTDVGGLIAALATAGVTDCGSMTVLGAGATARSALVSAAQLGLRSVTVLARRPEQARDLAATGAGLGLEMSVLDWQALPSAADLLLSTVTADAAAERADRLASSAGVVFDVVYDPWPTPLAEAAAARGRTVLNGLDLLVGQAVLQVELMTGHRVAAEVLQAAGREALAAGPA